MQTDLPSPPPGLGAGADPQPEVRRLIARHFLGSSAALALLAAIVLAFLPTALAESERWLLVLSCVMLSVLAALSMRFGGRRVEDKVALVVIATIGVFALAGTLHEGGIGAPAVAFFGVVTCIVCAVSGLRLGAVVAALCAWTVLVLAYAHALDPNAAWPPRELALRTAVHLLVIGAGLAGGSLLRRVLSRYRRSADERERRFRALLALASDAYWEIDEGFRLVTVTSTAGAELEDDVRAAVGRVPWDLPQFEIDEDNLDLLHAHLEAREPFRDLPMRWRDGAAHVRHFAVSGEPRQPSATGFSGYWGVARDVSTEVLARQTLESTENRYLDLFTRIPTPLVLHANGTVVDANPAALALFDQPDLASMLGQDLLAAYESGDSRERARRSIETLLALPGGEALPVSEFRLIGRDGRRIVVRASGVRVDTPDGAAVLSIYVDDTERKKAEDAVRRSEAMLSHLVATSPDVVSLTELGSGRYAMVNKSFERHAGYRADEVLGRTAAEIGLWKSEAQRERFVAMVRSQAQVLDVPAEFVTKSGVSTSMLVSGARFTMDRREYLVCTARDVSERERERLEREAILQNATVGIAVTRERRFVLANPRFEQMYGWAAGSIVGQSGRVVWHSDADYEAVGRTMGVLLARGEAAAVEAQARRFDGSSFRAAIGARAVDPARPVDGGTIWIVDDVTDRRAAEAALAAARDAAEAANRAKSAFLANTSHELRTPLNGLIGLARLAASADTAEPRRQQFLKQIGDTAQALSAIISDILDLSKIEAGKLEIEHLPFDLHELLDELTRAYAPLAGPRGIALSLEFDAGIGTRVLGDALRMRQIVGNYLSNALKFTAHGRVQLAASRLDAERVRIAVTDTGAGIDAATQARLFAAFTQADESTTRRYGGTGLGLSICRELAQLMGGEVGVISEPGQGSCFWTELPLPAAHAALQPPAVAEATLTGATVLVVEDNAVNMLIGVTLLEQWGVTVVQASDGREAVDAVRRLAAEGRRIDAVLMDVQMPHMSGHEATRELRAPTQRRRAADHRVDRRRAGRRARAGVGRGHERLHDQADRRRTASRHAGALDSAGKA